MLIMIQNPIDSSELIPFMIGNAIIGFSDNPFAYSVPVHHKELKRGLAKSVVLTDPPSYSSGSEWIN